MQRLITLFFFFLLSCNAKEYFLVTGTYTNTGSTGIYVHRFETADAKTTLVDSIKSSNPSFLVFSTSGDRFYAVNEDGNEKGAVSSYAFNRSSGKISFLNKQSSSGDHPCHLAIDKTGEWLVIANYSSGNLAAYALKPDGAIDSSYKLIQLTGESKHPQRQLSSHAHQAIFSPDNKYLYITDLGADKIMIYSFDEESGAIQATKAAFVGVDPGAGPRHLLFHPSLPFAYVIEELTGSLTGFKYDHKSGELKTISTVSTVPKDFRGYAGSAEIVFNDDGKYLYASNRGSSNSITTFSIHPLSGLPQLKQVDSSLGRAPRHISMHPSGKSLLVGNMDSDEIVIFQRNINTGLLKDTRKRINIKKPVCLQWVKMK